MNVELNPKLLDIVEAKVDLSTLGVFAGMRGTVVEMLGEPPQLFLVEMADQSGITKGFATLTAEQIRSVWTYREPAVAEAAVSEATRAFEEGILNLQNGLIEEAKRQFARAFELDPQLAGNLVNAANDLARKGAFDAAIVVYELILDVQPQRELARENLAITHLNRGVEYARRGAIDKALEDFTTALLVGPSQRIVGLIQKNLVAAYTQLGIRHAEIKRYEEATDNFVLAFALSPSDTTRRNLGLTFVSLLASKMEGRVFMVRERILRQAMRMGLSLSECLNAYGATLASLGQMSEARQALEAALEANPANELAKKNLEIVLAQKSPLEIPVFLLGLKAVEAKQCSVS